MPHPIRCASRVSHPLDAFLLPASPRPFRSKNAHGVPPFEAFPSREAVPPLKGLCPPAVGSTLPYRSGYPAQYAPGFTPAPGPSSSRKSVASRHGVTHTARPAAPLGFLPPLRPPPTTRWNAPRHPSSPAVITPLNVNPLRSLTQRREPPLHRPKTAASAFLGFSHLVPLHTSSDCLGSDLCVQPRTQVTSLPLAALYEPSTTLASSLPPKLPELHLGVAGMAAPGSGFFHPQDLNLPRLRTESIPNYPPCLTERSPTFYILPARELLPVFAHNSLNMKLIRYFFTMHW